MSELPGMNEFRAMLAEAIPRMDKLSAENSDDPMLASIQRQLHFVDEWTADGKLPTQEQVKKLSFGVMASRAVDELDRPLAQVLYALANYLDHLPVV